MFSCGMQYACLSLSNSFFLSDSLPILKASAEFSQLNFLLLFPRCNFLLNSSESVLCFIYFAFWALSTRLQFLELQGGHLVLGSHICFLRFTRWLFRPRLCQFLSLGQLAVLAVLLIPQVGLLLDVSLFVDYIILCPLMEIIRKIAIILCELKNLCKK